MSAFLRSWLYWIPLSLLPFAESQFDGGFFKDPSFPGDLERTSFGDLVREIFDDGEEQVPRQTDEPRPFTSSRSDTMPPQAVSPLPPSSSLPPPNAPIGQPVAAIPNSRGESSEPFDPRTRFTPAIPQPSPTTTITSEERQGSTTSARSSASTLPLSRTTISSPSSPTSTSGTSTLTQSSSSITAPTPTLSSAGALTTTTPSLSPLPVPSLSTSTRAAIGVGTTFFILLLLSIAAFLLHQRRRREGQRRGSTTPFSKPSFPETPFYTLFSHLRFRGEKRGMVATETWEIVDAEKVEILHGAAVSERTVSRSDSGRSGGTTLGGATAQRDTGTTNAGMTHVQQDRANEYADANGGADVQIVKIGMQVTQDTEKGKVWRNLALTSNPVGKEDMVSPSWFPRPPGGARVEGSRIGGVEEMKGEKGSWPLAE
ncbi:hypothetical protein M011DRAFT_462016 [Sporormia fimetaria CBS 119925]|uniref:Mid2 domain-containing protein n=1 Tax=Sporormia fimetaria CBS 119925 TaxID=1340428 RepID=A0A6A6UXP9_9PLEO|nr:hypothetical protein M011DRAFT_462016 [Sporormia fimetaria CBS 119925]